MTKLPRTLRIACCLAILGSACGGSRDVTGPTSTTPPPTETPPTPEPSAPVEPPAAPIDLTASLGKTVATNAQTLAITISWHHPGGADTFAIEFVATEGGTGVPTATLSGTLRSYVWQPPLTGSYVTRIRATNAAGSSVSNDLAIQLANTRDVMEALYLGGGPLAAPDGGCFYAGMMNGWEPGGTIRLVAAASLSASQRQAVEVMANHYRSVSMGANGITVVSSSEQNPRPRQGEIAIAELETVECSEGQNACARALEVSSGRLVRSASVQLRRSITQGRDGGIYHELGHALFGFCHVNGRSPLVPIGMSAMLGAGHFTDTDLAIARSAYSAGLRPGASRARFVAAGLVRP